MSADEHILTVQAIEALLPDGLAAVRFYPSLDSANNKAKELASRGCPHGTAVIAGRQTGGRGRFGREFISPPGGLYMSVVLQARGLDTVTVTAAAGVAVCRAIEAVTGREPRIKWVNDVLIDDKKVCGILSEAIAGPAGGGAGRVVVGIGVNIQWEGFPEELRPIAAALYDKDPGGRARIRLAAEILKNLLPAPPAGEYLLGEYKRYLSTLGKAVTVHAPDGAYEAVAEDIDGQCRLIVRLPGGERRTLHSGEVSVRQGG